MNKKAQRISTATFRPLASALFFLAAFACSCGLAEERTWTTSTFLDFADGTLADGGVNTYVAADGTVRLFNLWDLNNDGNFDLPVACPQDHNESVDLFIYWAGENGFAPSRRTRLPTEGAVAAATADLNGDGHLDLIVANRFDGEKTDLDCYIYWGSERGFEASRRSALPAKAAVAIAVADLNGDGHLDIVVANCGADYHMVVDNFQQSFVYWGSRNGYSKAHRLSLGTINCSDVKVADVDADGHLDIVFANEGNIESESGVTIYLGGPSGNYEPSRQIKLPGVYSSGVSIADLDRNGYVDLVLANKYQLDKKPDPPVGNRVRTYCVNSYIYWQTAEGFSEQRRTELPTVGAQAVAIGDLDGDGLEDIVFANSAQGESFIYWNGPKKFAAYRRSQIPAPGAHDVAIEDVNGDGRADLLLANYVSEGSFDTQSYIYWATPEGIQTKRPTELPTSGAMGVIVADLNGDGRKDVVFVNKIEGASFGGGTTGSVAEAGPTTSWIYWGDQNGRLSPDRRQGLPTRRGADSYINSDLDGDGYVDLLFPHVSTPTLIYWGSPQGFGEQRRSIVPDAQCGSGRVADFDRDGYLDLLLNSAVIYGRKSGFSQTHRFRFQPPTKYPSLADLNRDGWLDVVSPLHDQVVIYHNSPTGFDNRRSTVLSMPGKQANVAEIADFNADGYLDLVIGVHIDGNRPLEPGQVAVHHGNAHADSYIYWGGPQGYSKSRRLALPTIGTDDAVVADLNADGYLDVFFPSYLGGVHRHFPGYLYWNGPEGFHRDRKTDIPSYSGCGVVAADTNLDGYQELIIANHTRVGNHRSDVWVYEGGPDGYSKERLTSLPATGPHFFSFIDIGNIYDRGDRYDYISAPFDAGAGAKFRRISWAADTPFRTAVQFQVRTAGTENGLASAKWQGPNGPTTFYRAPGAKLAPVPAQHRWIQYKATLVSPNSANTPLLHSVSIHYRCLENTTHN